MSTFNENGFSLKEQILAIVAGLLIVAIVGWFLPLKSGSVASTLGVGTQYIEDYDPLVMQAGFNTNKAATFGSTLSVTGATTLTGAATLSSTLALTGAGTFSSTGSFAGLLTLNAGQLKSYTNASSSVTTGTLSQSDILGYDTILLEATGAAATKTLTLPATSTLTSFVPSAGDRQDTCVVNSTTTAATTITWAAGTGIDLETASSTLTGTQPSFIQPADSVACFTFIRKTSTDITAVFNRNANRD